MFKVIKECCILGALYTVGAMIGYGLAWLIYDGPEKIKEFKNRKYIRMNLERDDDEFDF